MATEDKETEELVCGEWTDLPAYKNPVYTCYSFDNFVKCKRHLEPRVLFHRGDSMIGDFCCGRFYQNSKETFRTYDEAKKALDESSYEVIGFAMWTYECGPQTAVGHGYCTLVERPAPSWTGVEKNSMMIPLTEGLLTEFLQDERHKECLSEEEKIFLKDGYTKAQWDAAEAKAKAELGED
jgi:hypothetical protein